MRLIFVIFVIFLCQNVLARKFEHLIETYAKNYMMDNCTDSLLKISRELSSTNVGRNFLETWKFTTPLELYSLNWYNLVGEDMKCKFNSPNSIGKGHLNRYCLYEIYNDNLTDGFLFTLCIPPTCNETHVEILGQLAHGQTNSLDKKATLQCSRPYAVANKWAFAMVVIIIFLTVFTTIVASVIYEIM